MELRDREGGDGRLHAGVGVQIAMRAIGNARLALAYWLRDEALRVYIIVMAVSFGGSSFGHSSSNRAPLTTLSTTLP